MENVSLVVAFSAGVLSFLSPCVLALVPVYLASLGGPDLTATESPGSRLALLVRSISFVVGFSLVFILLGALAGLTGYAFRLSAATTNKIAGILLVAFGVFMLAALKVPWLNYQKRLSIAPAKSGHLRAFIIGASFSLGWTACVGPVLAGILALASVGETAWQGAFLLSIYSLGLGVPFLIAGVAFSSISPLLKRIQRYATVISVISGLLLIGVGVLVLTGNLVRLFSILA